MAKREIRPIRVEGNVAYVLLTQGYEAIVDASSVPIVKGFNWTANVKQNTVYAYRKVSIAKKAVTVRLHRVIICAPDGTQVDHINGNGLDNRRQNLRLATAVDNMRNQGRRADNKSGFKGVDWVKRKRKWRATIRFGGRKKLLGLFETPQSAHEAYAEAAQRLFGAFARPI